MGFCFLIGDAEKHCSRIKIDVGSTQSLGEIYVKPTSGTYEVRLTYAEIASRAEEVA
jgi:hypothetical protein